MTVRDFTNKYSVVAIDVAGRYGLPADVVLTQAGAESGWGVYAYGNNFFGIKADSSWKGERQELWTKEFIGGQYVRVKSWFRKYASVEASFEDYCKFIRGNKRYSRAVADYAVKGDSVLYIRQIAAAGYATAPDYATKLINTLNSVLRYMPEKKK